LPDAPVDGPVAIFDAGMAPWTVWSPFSAPTIVTELSDPAYDDFHPSLTADGAWMVFSSWRAGGAGVPDLWWSAGGLATRPTTGIAGFAIARNLDELNTPYYDSDPFVTDDELEIWFNSDRPGGAGGHDLYVARRSSISERFGAPERIAELSSDLDNIAATISPDGATLYFNHATQTCCPADIWVATRTCVDH